MPQRRTRTTPRRTVLISRDTSRSEESVASRASSPSSSTVVESNELQLAQLPASADISVVDLTGQPDAHHFDQSPIEREDHHLAELPTELQAHIFIQPPNVPCEYKNHIWQYPVIEPYPPDIAIPHKLFFLGPSATDDSVQPVYTTGYSDMDRAGRFEPYALELRLLLRRFSSLSTNRKVFSVDPMKAQLLGIISNRGLTGEHGFHAVHMDIVKWISNFHDQSDEKWEPGSLDPIETIIAVMEFFAEHAATMMTKLKQRVIDRDADIPVLSLVTDYINPLLYIDSIIAFLCTKGHDALPDLHFPEKSWGIRNPYRTLSEWWFSVLRNTMVVEMTTNRLYEFNQEFVTLTEFSVPNIDAFDLIALSRLLFHQFWVTYHADPNYYDEWVCIALVIIFPLFIHLSQ